MADSFQVLFGDSATGAADAFYDQLTSLEVEENADLPGAVEITLAIAAEGTAGSEDLTLVGDDHLKPYARIAVVATPDGGTAACIFDGYVLSHKIHLDPGTTAATLKVWGQDVTSIMNLKEVTKLWAKTDGNIAKDIFSSYGFKGNDDNTADDSPDHPDDGHPVVQRATDAQFLRDRARRNGRLFRVCCADKPGNSNNTGYFIKPKLDGSAVTTLVLNPPEQATIDGLDVEWDVARPTSVFGQVLLKSKDAESGDTKEAGLALLDSRSLKQFTGGDGDKLVTEARVTATADSAEELKQRGASLLREASWFVRCEGETDLARQRAVLRVATVVQVGGAGKLHSGKYYVWSVRHVISADAHKMKFVLVRNAVGSP
jgi:hypothetical protein